MRSAGTGVSFRGFSIAGGCWFIWILNVLENNSPRILFLDARDQRIAVRILPQPEVSRLYGT